MTYFTSKDTALFQVPTVADVTLNTNSYTTVYTWVTHFLGTKQFHFSCIDHPVMVELQISHDGVTFSSATVPKVYTVTPAMGPSGLNVSIMEYVAAVRIYARCLNANTTATLTTGLSGTSTNQYTVIAGESSLGRSQPLLLDTTGAMYVNAGDRPDAIGFQAITVTNAAAVSLTSSGTRAIVSVEGNSVRVRWDGTAPTTSVGHLLASGAMIELTGNDLATFKAIAVGADAIISVTYSSEA